MRYQVIEAAVQFGPGIVLGLTVAQAADRLHRLTPVDAGYRVDALVEFKVGEVIEIADGDVGKAMLARLHPLDLAEASADSDADPDADPNTDPGGDLGDDE